MFLTSRIGAVLLVVMTLISCTSTVPVTSNNNFPSDGKYEVLGRVSIETEQTQSGYALLLAEAQKEYPGADDIVNIMVDAKRTDFLFIFSKYTYKMTAIAIKYN